MDFRTLGVYGGQVRGARTTSFLIDGKMLLDAGGAAAALSLEEQLNLEVVLLSHYHFDHLSSIPFLADNLFGTRSEPLVLAGIPKVLEGVRDYLMNNRIWPDFTLLPAADRPTVSYLELTPEKETVLAGYTVIPIEVNHTVPTTGFIIYGDRAAILHTSDTRDTSAIWKVGNEIIHGKKGCISRNDLKLSAVIIEVSFPNRLRRLADLSGHLCPATVKLQLDKLDMKVPAYLYHFKPQFYDEIRKEIEETIPDRPFHFLNQDEAFEMEN